MTVATPLFNFGDTFDATVAIGDVALPIHVKRFSRAEIDDFEKKWAALVAAPRGSAELTNAEKATRESEQLAFFESSIRAYVTVDAGLLVNRHQPVTDGAGVIDMFYARKDVLSSFMAAIYVQNKLGGVIRKNLNSPRATDTGSAHTQARDEGTSGSIAGSAEPSSTATPLGATDESASPEDAPVSSGKPDDPTRVH